MTAAPSRHVVGEWVRTRKIKPMDKLVLMLICDRCGTDDQGNWHTWVGLRTISDESGLAYGTVRNIVARLTTEGLITRQERRRANGSKTSSYTTLTLADAMSLQDDKASHVTPQCTAMSSHSADQKHQKKPQPILQESVSPRSSTTAAKRRRAAVLKRAQGLGWAEGVRPDEDIWSTETDTQTSQKEKAA